MLAILILMCRGANSGPEEIIMGVELGLIENSIID